MVKNEIKYLLGLSEVEGLRGKKLKKILDEVGDAKQIWMAGDEMLNKWGVSGQVLDSLRAYKRSVNLDKKIVQYKREEIELLPIWSDKYPPNLKEIDGAPGLLFVKGNLDVLNKKMMAVVGSRDASDNAKDKTAAVSGVLVNRGFVVVSGLAQGIDGYAHKACLGQKGETVAVLAHGLERIYPKNHQGLAGQILETGGVLVSEQPMNAEIKREYFLERNRIMVGMSEGLVVVEAQVRSGSMASANRAASMGREVWAVEGSVGTDLLIKEGANKLAVDV